MSSELSRLARLQSVVNRDKRYRLEAYVFVIQALYRRMQNLKENTGERRHLTAVELLEGIRELGWERYGRLAKEVFEHWGVRATDDFGEIVFNLIEAGEFTKTDEDKREDFNAIFDFEDLIKRYPIGDGRETKS
ncbi:hypothetical protein JXM67_07875 [candidate division WOR-3 bacterium]|nr:hypothetical protein [candidate division WOR-3 bacterium]